MWDKKRMQELISGDYCAGEKALIEQTSVRVGALIFMADFAYRLGHDHAAYGRLKRNYPELLAETHDLVARLDGCKNGDEVLALADRIEDIVRRIA